MMKRKIIEPSDFVMQPFAAWDEHWFLLTAGTYESGSFNTMTVGWGSMGTVWMQPFVQVFVRPSRHTYEFLNSSDDFTLSGFGMGYRKELLICGNESGREVNKVEMTGLTPVRSEMVKAPGFDEAELIIECRKLYKQPLDAEQLHSGPAEGHYGAGNDVHDVFFGQVLRITATDTYRKNG